MASSLHSLMTTSTESRHNDAQHEAEMVVVTADEDITTFFARNGFEPLATQRACDEFARLKFPEATLTTVAPQGYCSYTLSVDQGHLLQFRPAAFSLNLGFSEEARHVFKSLVPSIRYLGLVSGAPAGHDMPQDLYLRAYLQERIPGVTLAAFRSRQDTSPSDASVCRRRLVEDIAQVFAISFQHRQYEHGRQGRAAPFQRGNVGSSLEWRADILVRGLREKHPRQHAQQVQQLLGKIEASPWCLTHGDMVPANIMVDATSGRLTGLIDWAEGEWLPFGVGLYGLEEILGEDVPGRGFQYYPEHEELRQLFWCQFFHASGLSPPLLNNAELCVVSSARRLGILLWRGIAFEDGRIDRVVEAGRDSAEIQKLQLFLQTPDGLASYGAGSDTDHAWLTQLQRWWAVMKAMCSRIVEKCSQLGKRKAEVPLAKVISSPSEGS